MSLNVIGVGVGRTGTYSLKLAINQLGLGPCFHMEEVLKNMAVQVPLWSEALQGRADWETIYKGFTGAVDWPTAGFFRELLKKYPTAKFVLTERSPESWADSFGSTIFKLVAGKDKAPPEMRAWLDMAEAVIAWTGFPPDLDREGLMEAFVAHNRAVRECIPSNQLLVFEVRQGWEPLCDFLGTPIPAEEFPRSNDRGEFWDLVNAGA
ncbi:sulfotransferase family protein [Dokdonella sp.]|uniref:sulfotransferase family protein n=1 Tax=Dokdonella sp. TaxID=2291710 RepID=UPI0035287C34